MLISNKVLFSRFILSPEMRPSTNKISFKLCKLFKLALGKKIVLSVNCTRITLILLLPNKKPQKIPHFSTLNINLLRISNTKQKGGRESLKSFKALTHPLAQPLISTAKLIDDKHPQIHDLHLFLKG